VRYVAINKLEETAMNALGISPEKDPFPISSPLTVDYWADNKDLQKRIIQAQLDSILFASNALYVFWGPLGVGKTFAAHYLANPKAKQLIEESVKKSVEPLIFRVVAAAPARTGQLIYPLFRDIVEKCFSVILKDEKLTQVLTKSYDQIENGKIKNAFRDIQKRMIKTFAGRLNIEAINQSEGYKLLVTDKSKLGKIQDINELISVIQFLVQVLLHRFTRVIIVIDELENLAKATRAETFLVSDLLRKMHDEIDHGLTLILIFTFDSFEEVQQMLQKSLVDRIRDKIEFDFVENVSDITEYINDCIKMRTGTNPDDIIAPDVVKEIAETLNTKFKKRLSFRDINKEMHRIFSETFIHAGQPSKYKLDLELYQSSISSITPDEVIQQLKNAE